MTTTMMMANVTRNALNGFLLKELKTISGHDTLHQRVRNNNNNNNNNVK